MAEKKRVQKRGGAQGKARRTAENRSKTGTGRGQKSQAQQQRTQRSAARPSSARASQEPQRRDTQAPAGNFIEGRRAAFEALRTGFPIKRALIAQGVEGEPAIRGLIAGLADAGVAVKQVPRAQLDALSSHGAHQGIALEVGRFPYADLADIIDRAGDGPALVLVLDHVTDAGNFGAIVRSAEVVGASGVVIANKRAAEGDGYPPCQTSAGAVATFPSSRSPTSPRALDDLKAAGFWVGGASEHADDICWDAPFEGRVALVMGSEGDGISRLVLDKCDFLSKLPQLGATESLNVAQAATSLCFEWLRRNYAAVADRAAGATMGEQRMTKKNRAKSKAKRFGESSVRETVQSSTYGVGGVYGAPGSYSPGNAFGAPGVPRVRVNASRARRSCWLLTGTTSSMPLPSTSASSTTARMSPIPVTYSIPLVWP